MVQVCSESFECKVSAKRMWHGLFKDAHNCLPKAVPFKVVGVEYPHGQHGFELPGAERLIKFHKVISDELKELVEKEEALAKEAAEKVGCAVQKEALLVKEKAEEVVGAVHKEECFVKEKVEEVAGAAHKAAHIIKEEVEGAAHKDVGAAYKGAHFIKEEVGGAAHAVAHIPEKVLHEEVKEAHKALEIAENVVHKEEEEVGGGLHKMGDFLKHEEKVVHKEEEEVEGGVHKMGDFLKHEELWVKEKIEEVDHEAFKITISVLAGGLIAILFKHCKHTFEIKDTSHAGVHGSILHWTSEFEALSTGFHLLHSFDKLKKHALDTFHGLEAYLLKHDDYAHC